MNILTAHDQGSFVEAKTQEKSPIKEHESREKDEEQAQQQWEKYSIVENQQENIFQSNNLPHQLIDKKGRQEEHEETLNYMKFMEFLAKRRNFKEDVFFVTFMPP
ncbi:hypothetical protein HKD37_14G040666 [Glycine soja]